MILGDDTSASKSRVRNLAQTQPVVNGCSRHHNHILVGVSIAGHDHTDDVAVGVEDRAPRIPIVSVCSDVEAGDADVRHVPFRDTQLWLLLVLEADDEHSGPNRWLSGAEWPTPMHRVVAGLKQCQVRVMSIVWDAIKGLLHTRWLPELQGLQLHFLLQCRALIKQRKVVGCSSIAVNVAGCQDQGQVMVHEAIEEADHLVVLQALQLDNVVLAAFIDNLALVLRGSADDTAAKLVVNGKAHGS
mmetsp:Transcript_19536/g.57900  ORF Transcript_19536/g.57900 Transcript_19536/m.57900 type:complete len:244 (+) Transcript_19536:152-883(+)